MRLALDAVETYERLGSPEGELALAEAAIYLACAAKSNAVYVAYNRANDFVKQDESRPVPVHLRNAPTKLMKDLGNRDKLFIATKTPIRGDLPAGAARDGSARRRDSGAAARSLAPSTPW